MNVALITTDPLAIVQEYPAVPDMIRIPGLGDVHAPSIGWTSPDGAYMLVDVVRVNEPEQLDQFSVLQETTMELSGTLLTITSIYVQRDATKSELLTYSANKRWQKETGGTVSVDDVTLPTNRIAQTQIAMAAAQAKDDDTIVLDWKLPSGFVELDAAQIIDFAHKMHAWVEQWFSTEKMVAERIEAGTTTTTAQIDAIYAGPQPKQ